MEVTGRRGKIRKQPLDGLKKRGGYSKLKRGSTRSHPVENWLWKRLWTCPKADCRIVMVAVMVVVCVVIMVMMSFH